MRIFSKLASAVMKPLKKSGKFVAVLAAAALLIPFSASPAVAADGSNFDPGYIISDENFFNGTAMSATEVQQVLNSKVPRCTLGDPGRPAGGTYTWSGGQGTLATACLKDYSENLASMRGDSYCAPINGGTLSAAQMIQAVGLACNISQKVLIVLLEKEQSLISDSWPSTTQYAHATGFNCPDTAPCSSASAGFFKQLYAAARQFQVYTQNTSSFNYHVGVNNIRFNPNVNCGSSQVMIANQATANLYIYTPYQPNASALNNLYGVGDTCGAYGNRNFWRIYSDWFGSPTVNRSPQGNIDLIQGTAIGVNIQGWVYDVDTNGPVDFHVYSNGAFVGGGSANSSRTDVASFFGISANHGINATIPTPLGDQRVCVYALNVSVGRNVELGCKTVRVEAPSPRGWLDGVDATATGVMVQGWTFEPGTTNSSSVHVYTDGKFAAGFGAANSRTDVQAAFPGQSANTGFSGFVPLSNGQHQICVYALNVSGSKSAPLGCRTVDVSTPQPRGFLDSATGVSGGITVAGWAFEPGSQPSVDIHVYIDGAFAKGFTANSSRPDVKSIFTAQSANHGFSSTITAAAGSHTVCIYALNTSYLRPLALGCRTVTAG
jgi:hypothetical protein